MLLPFHPAGLLLDTHTHTAYLCDYPVLMLPFPPKSFKFSDLDFYFSPLELQGLHFKYCAYPVLHLITLNCVYTESNLPETSSCVSP